MRGPHGRRERRRRRKRGERRCASASARGISHGGREDSDLVQPDGIPARGAEDVGKGELQETVGSRVIHLYARPFAYAFIILLLPFPFPFLLIFSASRPRTALDFVLVPGDDAQHASVRGDDEPRAVAPREAHPERDVQHRARTAEDEVGAQPEAGDEVGRLRVRGHGYREGCAASVCACARAGAWDKDGRESGVWGGSGSGIETRGGTGIGSGGIRVGIGGYEGVGGAEEV